MGARCSGRLTLGGGCKEGLDSPSQDSRGQEIGCWISWVPVGG